MKQFPKISIKHYLNKKLKTGSPEDGYSVYYYITIKRRTIIKPSIVFVDFVKENEFEDSFTQKLIEREHELITKVCELYLTDLENGKVNKDIKLLADREFNSKDEFVNGLNSYISYYYEKDVLKLLDSYQISTIRETIFERLESVFDLSMFDIWDKIALEREFNEIFFAKREKFFAKNLQDDTLANYSLSKKLEYWLLEKYNSIRLSIIGYKEIRHKIPSMLQDNDILANENFDFQSIVNQLGINEEYIKKKFLPIIDKIINPNYQLSEYKKAMN